MSILKRRVLKLESTTRAGDFLAIVDGRLSEADIQAAIEAKRRAGYDGVILILDDWCVPAAV